MQEVDFRQVYKRILYLASRHMQVFTSLTGLFYPHDSAETVYPADNASAVYQTLDVMPLFWQEANTAHEHMLTT